jgi:AcrR family transcriptional regulator
MVQKAQGRKGSVTKKDLVTDFRRTEILQAARRTFSRLGYQSATVDAIAEEAGIAKGTVYLYFKSKEEIYLTDLHQYIDALQEETDARVAKVASAREKLAEFMAVRLEYCERNVEFVRIFFSEASVNQMRFHRDFKGFLDHTAKLVQSILDLGIARGEIRKVPIERTALAINDLTKGTIERHAMGLIKKRPSEDVNFVVDFLWSGLERR